MYTKISTLVLLSALVGACGANFTAKTPKGFVELEDQESRGYDYRAVTADGVVIAVRELEHRPKGELEFWSKAIENHMRRQGGYAFLDSENVSTSSGLAGIRMRFGHDRGKEPHIYRITVMVTDDHLFVMEAGGTKEQMEKYASQIEEAEKGFRVD